MPRHIPDEIREKALTMLETEDIDTVASALRIRKGALKRMTEDEAASVSDTKTTAKKVPILVTGDTTSSDDEPAANERQGRYSPEFKAAALAMMEEKGAVATIRELGISSYTLYDWKRKAQGLEYPLRQGPLAGKTRKRYTPDFKAEVIEYYQSHGAGDAVEKYGIANNTLFNWLDEAGYARVGNLHAHKSDRTGAIALYREKGAVAVLKEYGISKTTLLDWLKAAGIDTSRKPKYPPEFIATAVAMAREKPLTSVAKELGIPASTLATWKMKSRKD